MQKFDSDSLYNRSLSILQTNPNWEVILNNSVIDADIRSHAEMLAELARYGEYLCKESKWDTAQNTSSILAQSNSLGYSPKRKVSATGVIKVSCDPTIHMVGKSLSTHTLEKNNEYYSKWSVPTENIDIDYTASITDDDGHSYVAVSNRYNAYEKFVDIRVVQGIRKAVLLDLSTMRSTYTTSKLDSYLYIPVTIENCENASSTTTKNFFRVFVGKRQGIDENGNTLFEEKEYRVLSTLLLSGTSDYDVSVYNDNYSRDLFYLKFNNDRSRGPVLDLTASSSVVYIRIEYIESLGAEGNVYDAYKNFTITGAKLANSQGEVSKLVTLYGINQSAFVDGRNEETIQEIKENAPKEYIHYYTSGTKEAYEKRISNLDFSVDSIEIKPRKVNVYQGELTNETTGYKEKVTNVTFISDNLDDLSKSYNKTTIYTKINNSLNYYLAKLKAPQDTINFVAPTYIQFSVGLDCYINSSEAESASTIDDRIRNIVDAYYGSRSSYLDFGRDFYPSELTSKILSEYDGIKNINLEVEANYNVEWSEALRINPMGNSVSPSTTVIHTLRLPFRFSRAFLGSKSLKGFKDYRDGSKYIMRVDFLYKSPKSGDGNVSNTMIFLGEDANRNGTSYYIMHKNGNSLNWGDFSTKGERYSMLIDSNGNPIPNNVYKDGDGKLYNLEPHQFPLRNKVYTDSDYIGLLDQESENYIEPITNHLIDNGCIDNYLIYYTCDYSEDSASDTLAEGWIEIDFDSIYSVLSNFSRYDATLASQLSNCPLAYLQCGQDGNIDEFNYFASVCSEYIEVIVSMRPIDTNILVSRVESNAENSLIYIDTYDSNINNENTINLTSVKRNRFVSVDLTFKD